ncbi:MAG: SDR family oxidoreductase [Chitinispirillaceae bacterium]
MPVRILVTGATGVVGTELVRRFAAVGVGVRAAIRGQARNEKLFGQEVVQTVPFDFTDKTLVDNALDGIREVFLLTPEVPEMAEYVRIFLEQAREKQVSHIVLMSFLGADRVPMIRLSRWHHEAELYVMESGIPYTIVRPNLFMQNFITRTQPSGGLIYLPLGKGKVSYVDARDVAVASAEILVTAHQHASKVYRLTGPQSLSIHQVTQIISEVTRTHVEFADISEETARHVLESSGMPAWHVDANMELYALERAGLLEEVSADYQLLTGTMQSGFLDFARDHANVLRDLVEHEEE